MGSVHPHPTKALCCYSRPTHTWSCSSPCLLSSCLCPSTGRCRVPGMCLFHPCSAVWALVFPSPRTHNLWSHGQIMLRLLVYHQLGLGQPTLLLSAPECTSHQEYCFPVPQPWVRPKARSHNSRRWQWFTAKHVFQSLRDSPLTIHFI